MLKAKWFIYFCGHFPDGSIWLWLHEDHLWIYLYASEVYKKQISVLLKLLSIIYVG